MKTFIRRLTGILMALAMLFASVISPVSYSAVQMAYAENESGEQQEGENLSVAVSYTNLKRLYDLFFESANGDLNADPASLLGDEWTAASDADKSLLPLLISGEKEFVFNDSGDVIGVQDRQYDSQIPLTDNNGENGENGQQGSAAGNPDIPGGNNGSTDPQDNLPVVPTIQDPEMPGDDDDDGNDDNTGSTGGASDTIIPVDPLDGTLDNQDDDDDGNDDDDTLIVPNVIDPVLEGGNDGNEDDGNDDDDDDLSDIPGVIDPVLDGQGGDDDNDGNDDDNLSDIPGVIDPVLDGQGGDDDNDGNDDDNLSDIPGVIDPALDGQGGDDDDDNENDNENDGTGLTNGNTGLDDMPTVPGANNVTNPDTENTDQINDDSNLPDEIQQNPDENNDEDNENDDENENDNEEGIGNNNSLDNQELNNPDENDQQNNDLNNAKAGGQAGQNDESDDTNPDQQNKKQTDPDAEDENDEDDEENVDGEDGENNDDEDGDDEDNDNDEDGEDSESDGEGENQNKKPETLIEEVDLDEEVSDPSLNNMDPSKTLNKLDSVPKLTMMRGAPAGGLLGDPVTVDPLTVTFSQNEYDYTGEDQKVTVKGKIAVTITGGSAPATEGTDYSISFSSDTVVNVGNYKVTITGLDSYDGFSEELNFTIKQVAIPESSVSLNGPFTYTGSDLSNTIVSVSEVITGQTPTYSVSFMQGEAATTSVTDAGSYTVVVTGTGNYSGTISKDFTVSPVEIPEGNVTLPGAFTYTGSDLSNTIKDNLSVSKVTSVTSEETPTYSTVFKKDDDEIESVTEAGRYKMIVTGTGNYTGEISKDFAVTPVTIPEANVSLTRNTFTYTGNDLKDTITDTGNLTVSEVITGKPTTYSVSFKKDDNEKESVTGAGSYTLIITGTGNYTGTISKAITVNKALVTAGITGGTYSYDGQPHEASCEMTSSDITLTVDEDYQIYYKNGEEWTTTVPTAVGTYDVKIELTEGLVDNVELNGESQATGAIIIGPSVITSVTSSGTDTYDTTNNHTPTLQFLTGETVITPAATDYVISYRLHNDEQEGEYSLSELKDAGTYDVKITVNSTNIQLSEASVGEIEEGFVINKATITTATLSPTSKEADGTTNWAYKITNDSETTQQDAIVLTVKAGNITLTKDEFSIDGSLVNMTDVGTYSVPWALTDMGNKNFIKPDGFQDPTLSVAAKTFTLGITTTEGTYNRGDWRSNISSYLVVKDGETSLKEDIDYEVAVSKPSDTEGQWTVATEVKDAGTYQITATGKNDTPYAGYSPEPVTFTVNKAVVTSAKLDYNKAGYNRGNWYTKISVASPKTGIDYPNVLTIATGETDSDIKLTAEEAVLGTAVDMTDANTTAYTFTWDLTTDGQKNFVVNQEALKTVSFTVVPAEITSAEFRYNSVTYDRSNWYSKMVVGVIPTEPSTDIENNQLQISAKTLLPNGQYDENVKLNSDEVSITQQDIKNATTYNVAWTLKSDSKADTNYSVPETLSQTVGFTVCPAIVNSYSILYDGYAENTPSTKKVVVPYNRENWGTSIYLTGESEPNTPYANVIGMKASAVEGTQNAGSYGDPEDNHKMPLSAAEGMEDFTKSVPQMVNAGEYTDQNSIKVTLTSNYQDGAETPTVGPTINIPFKVSKAVIDSAELTYNHTYYLRYNWAESIRTIESTDEPPKGYKNILTVKTTEVPNPADPTQNLPQMILNAPNVAINTEYSIDELEDMTKANTSDKQTYSVPWTLNDTNNFEYKEGQTKDTMTRTLTVHKAEISSVTIQQFNPDGSPSGEAITEATTDYDHGDWAKRIGINNTAVEKSPHHYYEIVAKTAELPVYSDAIPLGDSAPKVEVLTLNDPSDNQEIKLRFNNSSGSEVTEIINAGNYPIWVLLTDMDNFKYTVDLDGDKSEEAETQYVILGVNVIDRYPVIPLHDDTTTVNVLSMDSVVEYAEVYRFGPNQNQSARTIVVSGEPGEVVNVTVGNQTITGTISGTRFSNYELDPARYTGTMNLNISSGGVLTAEGGEGSISLTHNTDLTVHLAYADASNLTDRPEKADRDPAAIEIPIHFDSQNPQIENSIASFLNRDMEVTFHVPEAGRLESIQFSETVKIDTEEFFDVRDYSSYNVTRPVEWNSGSSPQLIHSGAGALTMEYTDLVCNVTKTNFDIGQSTGAPIAILVEPIRVAASKERIDMTERPEQIRVTVTGTGWELMHTDLTSGGKNLMRSSDTTTASGAWAQDSTGEYSFIVDTKIFPDDADILTAAKYDDLVGSLEYTFYFDDKADDLIIALPEITEDSWVIPGIAEPGSSVDVYVDGEKITNRKRDSFTVFAARKAQLEKGSIVKIVAYDLSGNKAEQVLTVKESPANGKQTLDAYALGATHTTAHTTARMPNVSPEWNMAGLYTEEELTNGVTVPLVAACAFHIGEVDLKLENNQIKATYHPAVGVDLASQNVRIVRTQTKAFSMEDYRNADDKVEETDKAFYGYWVSAYAEAAVPVEMLHNSFLLDDEQKDIRDLYFNRQRKYPMPED